MWIVALVLSLVACQGESTSVVRGTASPHIDSLLAVAPQILVNMDGVEDVWLAEMEVGLSRDTLVLGTASGLTAIGDSIYIADGQAEAILAVRPDGYLQRQIGHGGEGPVEFDGLHEIHYNGSFVFAHERGHRIQVLTDRFEFVKSILIPQFGFLNTAVTSAHLYVPCPRDSYWLVCIRSASSPFDWREEGLLPVLDLPDRSGEEAYVMAVSPDGSLTAAGYAGFPFIFVYDSNFEHVRTIRFDGDFVRDFEPVITMSGAPGAGTRIFFDGVFFLGNEHLAAVTRPGTYIISVSSNDYRHVKTIKFKLPGGSGDSSDKSIRVDDLLLHGDHLYVTSLFEEYVYRYPFKL